MVDAAATSLGVPSGDLSGAVTAGTVAAQNLVRISATGSSPSQAQVRATAVAEAFVAYVTKLDQRQAHAYEQAVTSKLTPLKREIAAARLRLLSPNVEVQHNATVLLSGLVGQEESVLSSVAGSAAAAQPTVQLVAPGGAGTKVSPKPSLYGAIAFAATLLLLGRFLYVIGIRRQRFRETPVDVARGRAAIVRCHEPAEFLAPAIAGRAGADGRRVAGEHWDRREPPLSPANDGEVPRDGDRTAAARTACLVENPLRLVGGAAIITAPWDLNVTLSGHRLAPVTVLLALAAFIALLTPNNARVERRRPGASSRSPSRYCFLRWQSDMNNLTT